MNFTDILRLAESFSYLSKYFTHELLDSDFLDLPPEGYQTLDEQERQEAWFMINPEKINVVASLEKSIFIVSAQGKYLLLKAFEMLRDYSEELPEGTHFKERLLMAKKLLPPIFLSSDKAQLKEIKIIPFPRP